VADNILNQTFDAAAPNQVWLTDITYIPTEEGWLYLAGHKDLFIRSFLKALAAKRPATGLIHHSDRGSQYCAGEYTSLLNRYGMRASMNRKGNCYDNALMESFWGVLKNELIPHCRYATRQEAIQNITEYIEIFYNRQRKQAKLDFLSPAAFERWLYEKQRAA
jgi:putative transposase